MTKYWNNRNLFCTVQEGRGYQHGGVRDGLFLGCRQPPSPCPPVVGEARELCESFVRAPVPFGVSMFMSSSPPTVPPPSTITLGARIPAYEFEETHLGHSDFNALPLGSTIVWCFHAWTPGPLSGLTSLATDLPCGPGQAP